MDALKLGDYYNFNLSLAAADGSAVSKDDLVRITRLDVTQKANRFTKEPMPQFRVVVFNVNRNRSLTLNLGENYETVLRPNPTETMRRKLLTLVEVCQD